MDWIANMRGPDFLVLYTAVITCVILACVYVVRSHAASIYSGTIPVPSRPDPYEIAYLRGGDPEVARVAIVSLLDRGFLKLEEKGDLRRTEQAERGLQPVEHAILETFANTGKNPALAKIVQPFMAPYEEKLRREGLLVDRETKSYARRVAFTGCALIGFLGLFKLTAALEKGRRNVGLLILLGITGCIAVLTFSTPRRITRRGRAWLKNLQTSFEALRAEPAGATSGISHLPLLVGVFGASALAATAYAPLARQRHGTDTGCGYTCGGSSGGSGSGCGGGDSGGGGDGGGSGCGGCGGGGE